MSLVERWATVEATQTLLKHRGALDYLVSEDGGVRVKRMVHLALNSGSRSRLLRSRSLSSALGRCLTN